MRTLLLLTLLSFTAFAQKKELMSAKDLAAKIESGSKDLPLILNVGPMDNIKTAKKIGLVKTEAGMTSLKNTVYSVAKNKEIVIYCGCCSSSSCPNIEPAHKALQDLGYTKVKVLEIPVGLGQDWRDLGYPMENSLNIQPKKGDL